MFFSGAVADDEEVASDLGSVFFRPSQVEPGLQRQLGGTFVHVEFEATESDMLRAASLGRQLTEDLLAGLAVITGLQFGGVTFVQLLDVTIGEKTPFLFLLALRHLHSERSVTRNDIAHLQSMVAHWDHLPEGGRLRRAAGLYRRTIQEADDIPAFEEAYMGLEALEPALAEQIGVISGAEEVKGKCENCVVRRRVDGRAMFSGDQLYEETDGFVSRTAGYEGVLAQTSHYLKSRRGLNCVVAGRPDVETVTSTQKVRQRLATRSVCRRVWCRVGR